MRKKKTVITAPLLDLSSFPSPVPAVSLPPDPAVADLVSLFERYLVDKRTGRVRYSLGTVCTLCLLASLAGKSGPSAVRQWIISHIDVLRVMFGDLLPRVPCRDTIWRLMKAAMSHQLQSVLFKHLCDSAFGEDAALFRVLCLDGQVLRACMKKADEDRPFVSLEAVSLFDAARGLPLAIAMAATKSQEAGLVDELIAQSGSDLSGTVLTCDSANCHPPVADAVVKAGGNYLMTAKTNVGDIQCGYRETFTELLSYLDDVAENRKPTKKASSRWKTYRNRLWWDYSESGSGRDLCIRLVLALPAGIVAGSVPPEWETLRTVLFVRTWRPNDARTGHTPAWVRMMSVTEKLKNGQTVTDFETVARNNGMGAQTLCFFSSLEIKGLERGFTEPPRGLDRSRRLHPMFMEIICSRWALERSHSFRDRGSLWNQDRMRFTYKESAGNWVSMNAAGIAVCTRCAVTAESVYNNGYEYNPCVHKTLSDAVTMARNPLNGLVLLRAFISGRPEIMAKCGFYHRPGMVLSAKAVEMMRERRLPGGEPLKTRITGLLSSEMAAA